MKHLTLLVGFGVWLAWHRADAGENGAISPTPVTVSAGRAHSLVLRSDGSIVAWGDNTVHGILGDGTSARGRLPVPVQIPQALTAIAAGRYHSLALGADARVWVWGENDSGQLGRSSQNEALVPVVISSLSGVTAVAAGAEHSLALAAGRIWSWGANHAGQLGHGTTNSLPQPAGLVELPQVEQIAAGAEFSLALADGRVWAWGFNSDDGELGDGTTVPRSSPVTVHGIRNVSAIAAGSFHSVAISNGNVWAWGYNAFGQLGTGTADPMLIPGRVSVLSNIVQVSAGGYHSLALSGDGLVWAWGANERGQLGDSSFEPRFVPVPIRTLSPVTSLAAGRYHSIVTCRDGTVWSWGANDDGQLGDDTTLDSNRPVPVEGLFIPLPGRPSPLARGGIFRRGDGMFAEDYSTVVSLDFQKGIKLDREGRISDALFGRGIWESERQQHFDGADPENRLPLRGPVVAFGQRVGGSRLTVNRSYSFGAYAGERGNSPGTDVRLVAYDRIDMRPAATNFVSIPEVQSVEWRQFLADGGMIASRFLGLNTILAFVPPSEISWVPGRAGVLQLRHRADGEALGYIYLISVRGWINGTSMVMDGVGGVWSPLYTLEFDSKPAWEPVIVGQPHFEKTLRPHQYQGTSAEELGHGDAFLTNQLAELPEECLTVDDSPELRTHPILDRLVEDLRRDPLALASYVWNEIELTDGMSYGPAGSVGIHAGGINRGALGTLLEGQGSPWEQCALLIYLLRRSGVPALYVLPSARGLGLRQEQVSRMLRMQVAGLVDNYGDSEMPLLVPVHYPWVAAHVAGKWIHLFPWLKDTEIVEGLDLYDFLPVAYGSGNRWLKHYIEGDTNILHLSARGNTPSLLFPRFIERSLHQNFPGLSLEDLGMQVRARRRNFSAWVDFPQPHADLDDLQALKNLSSPGAGLAARLTNIFDTVRVEVYSVRHPGRRIGTGDLRMADLHNRRFVLYHQKVSAAEATKHRMVLTLAAYRPGVTGVGAFTNDASLLHQQCLTNFLLANDDELRLEIIHRRHRALPPSFTTSPPFHWDLFAGLSSVQEIIEHRPLRKGDLAALCLNTGRVTRRMLQVHAEEYWRHQREAEASPAVVVPPDLHQGLPAYLLGLSYYERLGRFDSWNEKIHKVRTLSWFGAGLAKLSPHRVGGALPKGEITLTLPNLDMFLTRVAVAGNGTYRPDSGRDPLVAARDYARLLTAEGSAQEHQTIEDYFGQTNALSTVKMLQQAAQQRQASGQGIVLVDRNNYRAQGDVKYGGRALKLHDPSVWKDVTNAFSTTDPAASTAQAWLTPGTNSFHDGTYCGMAALVLSDAGDSALISGNLHGAYGRPLSTAAFTAAAWDNLQLATTTSGDLSLRFHEATTAEPELVPELWESRRAGSVIQAAQQGNYHETPVGAVAALQIGQMLQLPAAAPVVTRVMATESRGFFGQVWDALRTVGAIIADPVHAISGAFYLDDVDLHLPGPMPLEMRRNYSSHNLAHNQLGYGWKLNTMHFLAVSTDGGAIYAAEPDGTVIGYEQQDDRDEWIPSLALNPQLNNHSSAGVGSTANLFRSRISRSFENGDEIYRLFGPEGGERTFTVLGFTNSINAVRPYLTRWQDAQGNFYTFHYGTNAAEAGYAQVRRIESSNGSFLGFVYDSYSQVIEAYTGDGRRLGYEYDRFGDLVRVTRPDGSELEFEYEHQTLSWTNQGQVMKAPYSSHLLTRVRQPGGRELMNEYDSERRAIAQWSTVGADLQLIENATFTYSNDFKLATAATNPATGYTIVRDVNGGETRFDYAQGLLIKMSDPLGQRVHQDWYTTNDVLSPGYYPRSLKRTVDKRGLETSYFYDRQGNLTNSTLRGDLTGAGQSNETAATTYVYNDDDLLIDISQPGGKRTRYLYDADYHYLPAAVISDAGGEVVSFNLRTYGCSTNLDSTGGLSSFACGLLRQEVRAYGSPDAATNEWRYDGRGFVTAEIKATGTTDPSVTNSFRYNNRGELVATIDALGRTHRFHYDNLGRRTGVLIHEAGETRPVHWEFSYYNENGELVWTDGPRTQPEDYVWRDYDGAGRLTQQVHWRTRVRSDASGIEAGADDAAFAVTTHDYDAFGNRIRTVDPRGQQSFANYDVLGRKTTETFCDGDGSPIATNRYVYEPGHQIVAMVDPLGGLTTKAYTANGRLKYQLNPDGASRAWRYQLDGRPRLETLPNGSVWEIAYDDPARRVVKVLRDPTNTLARFVSEFDRRGNMVRTVDPAGFATTNVHDALDRLRQTLGPVLHASATNTVQQSTAWRYGPGDAPTVVRNQAGETTVTDRDVLGRPRRIEFRGPDNSLVRLTSYAYSADGHSFWRREGSGSNALEVLTFTDLEERPLLEISSPSQGITNSVCFDYDAAGNLLARWQVFRSGNNINQGTSNYWKYDARNRVVEQGADGAATLYSYDAAGHLTNRVMPGGLSWSARYSPAGAKLFEQDHAYANAGRMIAYEYFPPEHPWAGLLHRSSIGGGEIIQTRSYDGALRLRALHGRTRDPGQGSTRLFTYDSRGLMTRLEEVSDMGPASVVLTRDYDGYGNLNREEVKIDGQTSTASNQSWDAAGRRRTLRFEGAPQTHTYDYNPHGHLAGVGFGGFRWAYSYLDHGFLSSRQAPGMERFVTRRDRQGQMLSQQAVLAGRPSFNEDLRWNGQGRLASYQTTGGSGSFSAHYQYSGPGRLLAETIQDNDQLSTVDYHFDHGMPRGPGTLTAIATHGASFTSWQAPAAQGLDAFSRLEREQTTFKQRVATGHARGADLLRARLGETVLPVSFDNGKEGQWSALLPLRPGPQILQVTASRNGVASASATNEFVVSDHPDLIDNRYDETGHVIARVWRNSSGDFLRRQSLTWDAHSRLIKVRQLDARDHGYEWTARYDALGRRVRTTFAPLVDSSVGPIPSHGAVTIDVHHDPTVEFLEVGWTRGGKTFWAVHGPDNSGRFGDLQGVGGMEAIFPGDWSQPGRQIVSDIFGNVIGTFPIGDPSGVRWMPGRSTAYGPNPADQVRFADSWSSDGPDLFVHDFIWRQRRRDPTGFYLLGKRYYDPASGRFLSPDPLGHEGSIDLYAFAHGDPVNFFDPDGRVGRQGLRGLAIGYTGLINTSVAVATLPLAFAERGVMHALNGAPVFSYLRDHLRNAVGSFAAFAEISQEADYGNLLLAMARQVPLIGNFVPGPRGNMGGPPVIVISGGIYADSEAIDRARHSQQASNMRSQGVRNPIHAAPYVRGTATEVLASLFAGYSARGLEHAQQVRSNVDPGNTVYLSSHSGGVMRSSIGSYYLGFQDIGVARSFAEQGPALGYYSNIGELQGNYSLGRDMVSNFGAILSFLYLGADTFHLWSFSDDPHRQGGHRLGGNEFNQTRSSFFDRPAGGVWNKP